MTNNEFTDNLSKYADPVEYDRLNESYKIDLNYMKNYLGERKETIIELACGTGRLAIPLAKLGHTVYGVDIDEGMLALAEKKAAAEGVTLHLSVQDCTKLALPIKTNFMYMTGNAFQHFLTNESQDALFASVKKHLNKGGEFVFNTRNPILAELSVVDTYEETYERNGETIRVHSVETYEPMTQILTCTSKYTSPTRKYEDSIKLRYTYPLELQRLLAQHGFEVIALYGSWKKAEFTASSVSMVVHARLK